MGQKDFTAFTEAGTTHQLTAQVTEVNSLTRSLEQKRRSLITLEANHGTTTLKVPEG